MLRISGLSGSGDPLTVIGSGSPVGPINPTAPSLSTTVSGLLLDFSSWPYSGTRTAPSGMVQVASVTTPLFGAGQQQVYAEQRVTAGDTGTRTASGASAFGGGVSNALAVFLADPNVAPTAPQLLAPTDGAVLNLARANTFRWAFSSPNLVDQQSAYMFDYRLIGAPSWTSTGWVSGVAQQAVVPAGTFTDGGSYEWQVNTKGILGKPGTRSGSGFFSAGTAPSDVAWVTPSSGGTVGGQALVEWAAADQDEAELRTVADDDGVGDPTEILSGPVSIVDPALRSALWTFPTNGRIEHLQVRVKYGGLWSHEVDENWEDALVTVSFIPPGAVALEIVADDELGTIFVSFTNYPGAAAPDYVPPDPDEPPVDEGETVLWAGDLGA